MKLVLPLITFLLAALYPLSAKPNVIVFLTDDLGSQSRSLISAY